MPLPPYGVVETTKRPVAAGETTCAPDSAPADAAEARVAAPGAPIVTIAVPEGSPWALRRRRRAPGKTMSRSI